jgi:hypothetical protein
MININLVHQTNFHGVIPPPTFEQSIADYLKTFSHFMNKLKPAAFAKDQK